MAGAPTAGRRRAPTRRGAPAVTDVSRRCLLPALLTALATLVPGGAAAPAGAREHDSARPVARDAATARPATTVKPGPLPGGGYVSVGSPDTRLVTFVQRRIARSGIRVDVDGVFGSETETAVRRFQATGRLLVDGIVGRQTMAALKGPGKGPAGRPEGVEGGESRLETPPAGSGASGTIRFVNEAHSAFDRYTHAPTSALERWMRDHYYRQKTYAPYFDLRLSWYPSAWSYKDAYAIYRGDSELQAAHPEWILKDAHGNKLYIPWGCSGGTCPQYAADIGNAAFRDQWIADARATMAKGYKGLFVDDVNMEFRVSNGNGDEVAPVDPRTGQTMTLAQWRRYMADFMEEIRRAFPGVEVAHNPIWFSGHTDANVARALLAADYINLERGVNDGGITAGGGSYGYETFLAHVDWLHERGKAVVFDSYTTSQGGTEYNMASYLLVNGTRDGFRTDYRNVPDDWWSGYDVNLGAAHGRRYTSNGLLRRDFERGYVLVNQPGRPQVTVNTPGATAPDGAARSSVTLGGGQGAVVVTPEAQPAAGAESSTPTPTPTPTPPSAPDPTPAPDPPPPVSTVTPPASSPNPPSGPSAPAAGAAADASVPGTTRGSSFFQQGGPRSSGGQTKPRRRTSISARVVQIRRAVLVQGRVRGHSGGGARISLFRRTATGWKRIAKLKIRLRSNGTFSRRLTRFPAGRYRVRAAYTGSAGTASSAGVSRFRLR